MVTTRFPTRVRDAAAVRWCDRLGARDARLGARAEDPVEPPLSHPADRIGQHCHGRTGFGCSTRRCSPRCTGRAPRSEGPARVGSAGRERGHGVGGRGRPGRRLECPPSAGAAAGGDRADAEGPGPGNPLRPRSAAAAGRPQTHRAPTGRTLVGSAPRRPRSPPAAAAPIRRTWPGSSGLSPARPRSRGCRRNADPSKTSTTTRRHTPGHDRDRRHPRHTRSCDHYGRRRFPAPAGVADPASRRRPRTDRVPGRRVRVRRGRRLGGPARRRRRARRPRPARVARRRRDHARLHPAPGPRAPTTSGRCRRAPSGPTSSPPTPMPSTTARSVPARGSPDSRMTPTTATATSPPSTPKATGGRSAPTPANHSPTDLTTCTRCSAGSYRAHCGSAVDVQRGYGQPRLSAVGAGGARAQQRRQRRRSSRGGDGPPDDPAVFPDEAVSGTPVARRSTVHRCTRSRRVRSRRPRDSPRRRLPPDRRSAAAHRRAPRTRPLGVGAPCRRSSSRCASPAGSAGCARRRYGS